MAKGVQYNPEIPLLWLDELKKVPAKAADGVAKYYLNALKRRFNSMETPDGMPWKPLSEKYKATKPLAVRDKILVLSGRLKDSFTYAVSQQRIAFMTTVPYAATHQFGSAKKNIPARPFLGFSKSNLKEIEKVIDEKVYGIKRR